MQSSEVSRAVAAAMSVASALNLAVDDASVLCNSNKLALRPLPCDVFARVAHVGQEVARLEVELALRLAETESPVATLEPRVEPRVYERDGFVVTLWSYYEPVTPFEPSPADYAEAQQLVASRDHTPALADADRELLSTKNGLRFIDLETCCRGPVEFDLAHVPEAVSHRYPDADQELLAECRVLVLAMVAAWRFDPRDQFPNGHRAARELLRAIREGPPWPALDAVFLRIDGP